MKPRHLAVLAAALAVFAGAGHAAAPSLRDFMQGVDFSAPQTGNLWTGRVGDANGALLPSVGPYYAYGAPQYNTFGPLLDVNQPGYGSGAYAPSFAGVFVHPGSDAANSTAVVFSVPQAVVLTGLTVHAEMVANGAWGNGVDVEVRHTRGATVTSLGQYFVSGPALSLQAFSFGAGLAFAAGDRIEVDVGSAGSYLYDHVNLNVELAAAPVPEPMSAGLMVAGLLGLGARRLQALRVRR